MARLPRGRRHFQHGPIDLILLAEGPAPAVETAYDRAWGRFETVLDELVRELPLLRQPLGSLPPELKGPVAGRMFQACWPFRDRYITPMAAVAGAVAEEILAAMVAPLIDRAMVNNGGDIAFFLAKGEQITLGVADDPRLLAIAGTVKINFEDPVRGVATSGWRGRSQSLGIADAVTVLARSAAEADAAATMIANEVNAEHPAIRRAPASAIKDDSDLGDLPVTVDVGILPDEVVTDALLRGEAEARSLQARGLIHGAVLLLQGRSRVIGGEMLLSSREPALCP